MKVAILAGYPFIEKRYGVAEHVFQISSALANKGVVCHIFSMHTKAVSFQVSPNIWLHTLKRSMTYFLWPIWASNKLTRLVCQVDPDVVHLHCSTLPYIHTALKLAKDVSVLCTIHGDVVEEAKYKPFVQRLWGTYFSGYLMERALDEFETIIVCSEAMKKRFETLRNGKIYVMYNGVDIDHYSASLNISRDKFSYILFIGALTKQKGIYVLLEALPIIYERVGHLPLYLAGCGPEETNLRKEVRKRGLDPWVKFLGYVSGPKKIRVIQDASMVVVPSFYESFPLVILEVMACGLPVVASNVGGIPEIITHGKNGYLFNAGESTQLADYVAKLAINPSTRIYLGEEARKRADEFTWSNAALQISRIYEDCINHKK